MAVPAKYRALGDFPSYYSGARKAPYLTLFVGGNHEASSHLFELYYGGWVAPNIYYLGAANVVWVGPLRIAGMSGIWKGHDYREPHHERLPYSPNDVRSIYHVREWDTRKLLLLRSQVDVGVSHDWPQGIEWAGDWQKLFRDKGHFEPDARSGQLGSVAAKQVLKRLRPKYWYSAHLHCKYAAVVEHGDQDGGQATALEPPREVEETTAGVKDTYTAEPLATNSEEIDIDLDDLEERPVEVEQQATSNGAQVDVPTETNKEEINIDLEELNHQEPPAPSEDRSNYLDHKPSTVAEELRAQLPESFRRKTNDTNGAGAIETLPFPEAIHNRTTNFLALDKCLPHRKFLQLSDVSPISGSKSVQQERPFKFTYDKEWLAINRVFAKDFVVGDEKARVPRDQGEAHYRAQIDQEETWVELNVVVKNKLEVPQNFTETAPSMNAQNGSQNQQQQPMEYTNSQTSTYCAMLEISNPFHLTTEVRQERMRRAPALNSEIHTPRGGRGGRGGRGWHGGRGGHPRGRGRSRY